MLLSHLVTRRSGTDEYPRSVSAPPMPRWLTKLAAIVLGRKSAA